MTIEQKILSKLEPHAKRIKDGEGNDFDYLPAVLLQVIEGQQRQAKLTDDAAKRLTSIESTVVVIGAQSKTQIAEFTSATHRKMEQIETAINDTRSQLQNSHSSTSEQFAVLVSAHEAHTIQTKEGLSAIVLQVESLCISIRQSHVKFMRLLVAGLIASTAMIGLAIVILQRH
jgi:hypothetical protein